MFLKKIYNTLRFDPILILALGFLVSQVTFCPEGGDNERSRFATLHAMASEQTFNIDCCQKWTGDWARTPNGHYFSNKAPGPMLIAFPAVWILEKVLPTTVSARNGNTDSDSGPVAEFKSLISILFQVIPCFLLGYLLLIELRDQGYSPASLFYGGLSLFFANTAMVFMNIYFGHGMAACFLILAAYAELKDNPRLLGFALGFAVLCDYGCALILVPWLMMKVRRTDVLDYGIKVFSGAIFPATLWIWYHTSSFGSPFSLPMKFQNPVMVDKSPEATSLIWGIISPHIHWDVLKNLLVGRTRGIGVTQPWVFLVWAFSFFFILKKKANSCERNLMVASGVGLVLLLWMNSGFNGWHGGGGAGPRYLSMVFPLFGVTSIFLYDFVGRGGRVLLWMALIPSLLLRMLIYASTPIPDYGVRLWPFYFHEAVTGQITLKLAYFFVLLGITWVSAGWLTYRFPKAVR